MNSEVQVNEPVAFQVIFTSLLQIPARSLKNLGAFSIETTSDNETGGIGNFWIEVRTWKVLKIIETDK
jgi:hypothetical protein